MSKLASKTKHVTMWRFECRLHSSEACSHWDVQHVCLSTSVRSILPVRKSLRYKFHAGENECDALNHLNAYRTQYQFISN